MKTAITYWLFVLLPTLLLGGLTLFFWFREMERTEREREALRDARVRTWEEAAAGSAAAVRLNFEEVRKGLMEVLREESEATLPTFPQRNPLVAAVQIWDPVQSVYLLGDGGDWIMTPLPGWREELAGDSAEEAESDDAPGLQLEALSRHTEALALAEPSVAAPPARSQPAPPPERQAVDDYAQQQLDTRTALNVMARQRSLSSSPAPARSFARSAPTPQAADEYAVTMQWAEEAEWPLVEEFDPLPGEGRREEVTGEEMAPAEGEGGWFWSGEEERQQVAWWQGQPGGPVFLVRLNLDRLHQELIPLLPRSEERVQWSLLRHPGDDFQKSEYEVIRGGVSPAGDLAFWKVAFQAVPLESMNGTRAVRWIGAMGLSGIMLSILLGAFLLRRQVDRAEQEARQKTGFVALVSHELRTPLTSIRLYAEMLDRGKNLTPENRTKYQKTLLAESSRLERMVGHLLRLSRLERTPRPTLQKGAINPSDYLTELVAKRRPEAGKADMTLELKLGELPASVQWDPDIVEQILTNLIDNAIKHAADGRIVMVEAGVAPGGTGVVIRVLDRGPGIPAAFRKKMFQRFTQVDDSLEGKRMGLGLGLALARQLARAHEGDLTYADRPDGGGCFTLHLP